MKISRLFDSFLARNIIGLLVLMVAHYLTDWYAIDQRPGILKITPYLYLLLLYGWLVVHDRVLFERLFLQGKKVAYFGWLFLCMALGSFNMNFILRTEFDISRSLPYLVNFWVYTVTGLGVFVTYRYLRAQQVVVPPPATVAITYETGYFSCTVDGVRQTIPYADIHYVESLENYLRIATRPKTLVTRLTLKEAEDRLPRPLFVRISRSIIVNVSHVDSREPDAVRIGTKELRIGKVYKRYVAEQWANK
ncbi:LytR/AlgR family response regulator transcription factor [Spirosoma koreense]